MKWTELETLRPRSLTRLVTHLSRLIEGKLWARVLLGLGLGVVVGMALGPSAGWVSRRTATTLASWLALPGHIFLATVQMIVIPLVFASIIRGLAASENIEQLRKTGLMAVFYFSLTTAIAVTLGIGVSLLISPGDWIDAPIEVAALSEGGAPSPVLRSIPDAITSLIPTNPLNSMVRSEMLQVVVFAIMLGVALASMSAAQSGPLLSLLGSIQEVSMTVVRWSMALAPFAVFGLIAELTTKLGVEALTGMSIYVATVLLGLFALLIVYSALIAVLGKRNPWAFLKKIRAVQLLAFSTSSSAAVMPLSIRTAEEELGVRPSIAQFVIPLAATINMDGTALYQGVATIFLAQVFGVDLSVGQLALVVLTAVAASIGSPATPGVGIVILASVLHSVGIPKEGIGLILGVDRILDMSRTALNVTGDLLAATLFDRWSAPSTSSMSADQEPVVV